MKSKRSISTDRLCTTFITTRRSNFCILIFLFASPIAVLYHSGLLFKVSLIYQFYYKLHYSIHIHWLVFNDALILQVVDTSKSHYQRWQKWWYSATH